MLILFYIDYAIFKSIRLVRLFSPSGLLLFFKSSSVEKKVDLTYFSFEENVFSDESEPTLNP